MNVAEILVVVPQANELGSLLGALVAAGYQPRTLTLGRLQCHLFEELHLLFAVGGHGKTQLAVRTQHLIEQKADFQVVICAGAAGSLGSDLALGDVVVGKSTIEHDYKLRFVRRPLPSYQADMRLLAEFASLFSGLQFLEVRAITDGADHTAAADFHANLERSMPNLAQILLKWSLARRHGSPTPGSSGRSSPAAEP